MAYTAPNKGQDMHAEKDALARKVETDFASMKKDMAELETDPVSSEGKSGSSYKNAVTNPAKLKKE